MAVASLSPDNKWVNNSGLCHEWVIINRWCTLLSFLQLQPCLLAFFTSCSTLRRVLFLWWTWPWGPSHTAFSTLPVLWWFCCSAQQGNCSHRQAALADCPLAVEAPIQPFCSRLFWHPSFWSCWLGRFSRFLSWSSTLFSPSLVAASCWGASGVEPVYRLLIMRVNCVWLRLSFLAWPVPLQLCFQSFGTCHRAAYPRNRHRYGQTCWCSSFCAFSGCAQGTLSPCRTRCVTPPIPLLHLRANFSTDLAVGICGRHALWLWLLYLFRHFNSVSFGFRQEVLQRALFLLLFSFWVGCGLLISWPVLTGEATSVSTVVVASDCSCLGGDY